MALYLVTGGAGFVGSHLVHELVRRGERVRVLDDFSTGRRENIQGVLDQIELVEGNLIDPEAVERAVKDVTFILHEGARPSVPLSIEDPLETHQANVTGTLNVLVAARRVGLSRVTDGSMWGSNERGCYWKQ